LVAIVSTPRLAMKFPSASGDVITLHVDQKTTRECYVANLWNLSPRPTVATGTRKEAQDETLM